MKQPDHRRRLIDSFVNAIYLFDDYLVITFNYKEGTKTIAFAEFEKAFGSDLSSLTAPAASCRPQLSGGDSNNPNLITRWWGSDLSLFSAPNSRNPNPSPTGFGFGFLFVFGDM